MDLKELRYLIVIAEEKVFPGLRTACIWHKAVYPNF